MSPDAKRNTVEFFAPMPPDAALDVSYRMLAEKDFEMTRMPDSIAGTTTATFSWSDVLFMLFWNLRSGDYGIHRVQSVTVHATPVGEGSGVTVVGSRYWRDAIRKHLTREY